MKAGEQFELEATEFLKTNYSSARVNYVHHNTADSTKSDIEVFIDGLSSFFIEAKDTSAQSGQFVLLPDESKKEFVFSKRNKSEENEMTDLIIKYMNNDFDRFNTAGTSGETIDIDNSVFAKWICEHYRKKLVDFFITKKNGFIILPIEKFGDYFEISANFRIKKSGSSNPSKTSIPLVQNLFKAVYPDIEFFFEDKKLFAVISGNLTKETISTNNFDYLLAPRDNGNYEIRQLSNTYNMNVIFSIRVKKEQANEDLLKFKKAIHF